MTDFYRELRENLSEVMDINDIHNKPLIVAMVASRLIKESDRECKYVNGYMTMKGSNNYHRHMWCFTDGEDYDPFKDMLNDHIEEDSKESQETVKDVPQGANVITTDDFEDKLNNAQEGKIVDHFLSVEDMKVYEMFYSFIDDKNQAELSAEDMFWNVRRALDCVIAILDIEDYLHILDIISAEYLSKKGYEVMVGYMMIFGSINSNRLICRILCEKDGVVIDPYTGSGNVTFGESTDLDKDDVSAKYMKNFYVNPALHFIKEDELILFKKATIVFNTIIALPMA